MSILTTTEVADFLGIDSSTAGLQAAINQAEILTAVEMGLATLEFGTYVNEFKMLTYTTQQIIPEHGPIRSVVSFTYDDEDYTDDVAIDGSGWSIRWADPKPVREFDRVRSFERLKDVTYSYTAGWTEPNGSYPLPNAVGEYVKMMSGMVLQNSFASGPNSLELGDMSIQFERNSFNEIKSLYSASIARFARPY